MEKEYGFTHFASARMMWCSNQWIICYLLSNVPVSAAHIIIGLWMCWPYKCTWLISTNLSVNYFLIPYSIFSRVLIPNSFFFLVFTFYTSPDFYSLCFKNSSDWARQLLNFLCYKTADLTCLNCLDKHVSAICFLGTPFTNLQKFNFFSYASIIGTSEAISVILDHSYVLYPVLNSWIQLS
jgi:hypothetical protein